MSFERRSGRYVNRESRTCRLSAYDRKRTGAIIGAYVKLSILWPPTRRHETDGREKQAASRKGAKE
jgi:hypothetical protein